MLRRFPFLLPLLLLCSRGTAHCAGLAAVYHTVDDLWRGYDARALPLEAQVIREWKLDGLVLRTVSYTAEIADGTRARIVAYYGFPAGGKDLPAILHIHGGGENATLAYVKYWANRGYAALSIDWGGRPLMGEKAGTDWGALKVNQNDADAASVYSLAPDPKANSWYHWTIACRRGITFLERQPEVDPSRIGVFGVSMGGQLTWLVAGTDHRLRAAVSIYGATLQDESIPGVPDSLQIPSLAGHPVWRQILDPYAYAPHILCPFLYLSAANDFYGRMDMAERTLGEIPEASVWRSYTPHYTHHTGSENGAALWMWFDRWLKNGGAWPQTPLMRVGRTGAAHQAMATLSPSNPNDVVQVVVYYSTGLNPPTRFWHTTVPARHGNDWDAGLPLTNIDHGVFVFGNVLYKSGLLISTKPEHLTASQLAAFGLTPSGTRSLIIDDFSTGATDWFSTEGGIDPLIDDQVFFVTLAGDVHGVIPQMRRSKWGMATRKVGDPQWRPPKGASLKVSICAGQPNTLIVAVTKNLRHPPSKDTHTYVASILLKGGNIETSVIAMKDFHEIGNHMHLDSWDEVDLLSVQGQYKPDARSEPIGPPWKGKPPTLFGLAWAIVEKG